MDGNKYAKEGILKIDIAKQMDSRIKVFIVKLMDFFISISLKAYLNKVIPVILQQKNYSIKGPDTRISQGPVPIGKVVRSGCLQRTSLGLH